MQRAGHRDVLALAVAVLAASTAGDSDSVVLADGTELRGLVVSCGAQIRFLPRGAGPEIELDAARVRSVHLADGSRCTETPRVSLVPQVAQPSAPAFVEHRWYGETLLL